MPQPCTVLISPAALLPALKERVNDPEAEILTFTDAEVLPALKAIVKRRPEVVAFERLYAATSRGAALINRIKADPKLTRSEIRVMAHDSDYMRVSPRKPVARAQELDQRGTRRAPRFKIGGKVKVLLDGKSATLVDLSTCGAQIVSAAMLKPSQSVRLELTDDQGMLQFNAAIAWASFEIVPAGGARYRAGIEFVDANAAGVDAFCTRHKA